MKILRFLLLLSLPIAAANAAPVIGTPAVYEPDPNGGVGSQGSYAPSNGQNVAIAFDHWEIQGSGSCGLYGNFDGPTPVDANNSYENAASSTCSTLYNLSVSVTCVSTSRTAQSVQYSCSEMIGGGGPYAINPVTANGICPTGAQPGGNPCYSNSWPVCSSGGSLDAELNICIVPAGCKSWEDRVNGACFQVSCPFGGVLVKSTHPWTCVTKGPHWGRYWWVPTPTPGQTQPPNWATEPNPSSSANGWITANNITNGITPQNGDTVTICSNSLACVDFKFQGGTWWSVSAPYADYPQIIQNSIAFLGVAPTTGYDALGVVWIDPVTGREVDGIAIANSDRANQAFIADPTKWGTDYPVHAYTDIYGGYYGGTIGWGILGYGPHP